MAMQTAIARQNRRGVWLYNQLLCCNSDILSSEMKTLLRGGISIQGPTVWAVPGSPHFYTIHGCGSLSSATDGNPHTQLSWRLAHSGPIAGGFDIPQDPPPQPLRLPGAQGQLCQEHTVTASFVLGHSYQLRADDRICLSRASPNNSVPRRLPSRKVPPVCSKLSRKSWALWQQLRRYFSWVCFTCDPSSSGSSRGFHPWLGVMVTLACVSALARWRDPQGVIFKVKVSLFVT